MPDKELKSEHMDTLCKAFLSLKNSREMRLFLEDILTPKELDSVMERFQIFRLYARGLAQRKIKVLLKTSISKITRGSHAWRRSKGGIGMVLRRLGYQVV